MNDLLRDELETELFRLQTELIKERSENLVLKRVVQSFIKDNTERNNAINRLKDATGRLWCAVQRMGGEQ